MPALDPTTWRQMSPLLDRALDLEPEARVQFMATLQSEQPRLARMLRELLGDHDRVLIDGFLEETTPISPAPPTLAGTTTTSIQLWNWATATWTSLASANINSAGGTLTGSPATVTPYIGTGANAGQVRVRVLATRTTNFTAQGNLLRITFDAP